MDGVYLGCFEGLYVPQIHMYESLCVCLYCMWYSEIQGKNMWESWNKPWSALVQVLYFIFYFFKFNFKGCQFFLDSLDLAYPHKGIKRIGFSQLPVAEYENQWSV